MLSALRPGAVALARPARHAAVRCCTTAAEHKLNIAKAVDKAHEGKTFKEVVKLPPGALQGLKEGKADDMLAAFKIKSIRDLAKWKHYRAARAIAVLAKTEVADARPAGSLLNVNGLVDQAYEAATLNELLAAPPSALQGLAPWTDGALAKLKIKSVGDLAKWKYASWADALVTLAEYEREDMSSR
ncbi:hypothetical protein OEZ85_009794 [Tetradesmus obliquus]|uniref:Uncharacterized protein n=1 Tax=Tetradesmus obliquus TaxID=3088 RepID=A0ABY8UAE1_TETOB|nr:hypothetical protein OEZ85_009794 [Tetradesmus obliquus]